MDKNKYKITVIVAVYNNGLYLKDRCIESLKKSTMFEHMEILLIDDGSTDEQTINIIKDLVKKYENINSYFYETGGSGTAARPRNMGVKIANADYITYLDPDNEAVNDGYYKLYEELKKDDLDIVLGNYEKISSTSIREANYYKVSRDYGFDCNNITDTKSLLIKNRFNVDSIQALLVKKELILDNNIVMEGIGEDTVFFYEIMLEAKRIRVIDEVIHLYYIDRKDSITNSINKTYFRGHLEAQKRKKYVFDKFGVLENYLNSKQEIHFKHYLYNKLYLAQDYEDANLVLREIYNLYEGKWNIADEQLRKHFGI